MATVRRPGVSKQTGAHLMLQRFCLLRDEESGIKINIIYHTILSVVNLYLKVKCDNLEQLNIGETYS
jgi:hypothetical protein